MSRWYEDDIQVATVARPIDEDPAGESPERFVWRGRLYLVNEVLASWRERQPWWVLCEEAFDLASPRVGPELAGGSVLSVLADGADRRCWRVRARAGRDAAGGVYELVQTIAFPGTCSAPAEGQGPSSGAEQIVGGGREAFSHPHHSGVEGGGGQVGSSNRVSGAGVRWRLTRVGD